MTVPTTCTKCGRPILWTDVRTIDAAAEDLVDATRYPFDLARAYEAIGRASAHMRMMASMLSGTCVVCYLTANLGIRPPEIAPERPSLRVVREAEIGIESQWTGAR